MSYVAKANEYIRAVLAAEIPTCRWTKLAVQRQLDDLARTDWEFYFDPEAAEVPCEFLEILTHVAGERGGERLHLEDWQCFIITTLFGWRRKDNGQRRFRKSFVQCGKGNGKSFISSGLCLYMLCADSEQGAQVLTAARTVDQARLVFDVAHQQVLANPELSATFQLRPMKKGIEHPPSGSVMKAVSAQGRSLAGLLPHFASVDETWAHRNRIVVDEIQRGCAKRANSLMSTITHAGENLASIGYEQYKEACAVLAKEHTDERLFACVWSGEGYDWQAEDGWRAANPNWNVSVYPDAIADAARLAKLIPSQQAIFRSHNLCEWLGASYTWLEPSKLVVCRERNLRMEDFKLWLVGEHPGIVVPDEPRPFAIGMDLASRQDILALIFTCIGYVNGVEHFYSFGKYYIPEKTIEASPIAQYRSWAARGLLTVMPGYSNDYEQVQQDVLGMYRQYLGGGEVQNPEGFKFALAAYDEWQADQIAGNLSKAGILAVPFKKIAKEYSPVMDWLTSLVLAGRWHFPEADEILLWCLSNVACKRDVNDNLFPRRAGDDENRKIDAAIALLYSLRAAMANEFALMRPEGDQTPRVSFQREDGTWFESDGNGGLREVKEPEKVEQDDKQS